MSIGNYTKRKYRNQPVIIDGIRFDSKREARRWRELQLLERAGEIKDLRRQVRFLLDSHGQTICRFVADFTYWEAGQYVVEDSKGHRTREYILKRKLMKACHDIDIRET